MKELNVLFSSQNIKVFCSAFKLSDKGFKFPNFVKVSPNEKVFVGFTTISVNPSDVSEAFNAIDALRNINIVVVDSGFDLNEMLTRQKGIAKKGISHRLGIEMLEKIINQAA